LFALSAVFAGAANAETRSLKLYFIHTGEKAEIVFKRNGRYDQSGLKKINQFLRDWRRNEPTRMDPRLLDLVWEAYRSVGARDYIHVVSAYRSPATNSMLRKRSKGVANKSQHMLGKAMDFFIPGVSLKKLRETGMKMQGGGVGYYPRSGSPFVHMDVGNVRHWPKMSRRELVALFPNGKTLHVPSDGKPLPGFDQALASYQSRKKNGTTALALAGNSGGSSAKQSTSLFAALFGGGEEEEADISDSSGAEESAAPVKPAPKAAAAAPVAPAPAAEPAQGEIEIIPPEKAKRGVVPLIADLDQPEVQQPERIIAALPARSVPLPQFAPRPKIEVGTAPMATASIPAQPQPESMPFGMAAEEQQQLEAAALETSAEPTVAANVPVPSWRPQLPAELVAPPVEQDVALASQATTRSDDEALLMALASQDPAPTGETVAMLPAPKPTADDEEFPVAALPETAPTPMLAPSAEIDADQKAAMEAEIKENGARVAALTATASPKMAIAARAVGTDPASAVAGVKTTRKTARASRTDQKKAPRAVVVSNEPDAARWVLGKEYLAKTSAKTKAPSFAYNTVVSAPREVYTAGFTKEAQVADANRFTGKAVKFLSVARFE